MSSEVARATPSVTQPPFYVRHAGPIATTAAVIMVALALLGVGLISAKSSYTKTYWYSLVPIFGLVSIVTAWLRSDPAHPVDRYTLLRHVFHWVAIGVAFGLDFFILRTGEESTIAAGENAVLILALGCFLAGIHHEPLFVLVGLLLTGILILVVTTDQYLWLAFVIGAAIIAGLVSLRVMVAAWHARHKSHF